MTEILYKPNDSNEFRWACNVVNSKAEEFVERKNRLFNYGTWKVKE